MENFSHVYGNRIRRRIFDSRDYRSASGKFGFEGSSRAEGQVEVQVSHKQQVKHHKYNVVPFPSKKVLRYTQRMSNMENDGGRESRRSCNPCE